jgi:uncharacterized protein (TIGR03437 family)
MQVVLNDRVVATGTMTIERTAPGLFSANANGRGAAAALLVRARPDGSQTADPIFQCSGQPGGCLARALDLGSETGDAFLILFGTGVRGRTALEAIRVRIGGVEVPVTFAGGQGQFQGLDQINVGPLPRQLSGAGEVLIDLTVEGKASNAVTVAFR